MSEHTPLPDKINIVFSGEMPNLTFVEVEDVDGKSVNVGKWLLPKKDGYSILQISINNAKLIAENNRLREALNDIAKGMIPKMPPLNDVLEFRTQMWNWSQKRANQALNESE